MKDCSTTQQLILTALFTTITAVSSLIRIPFLYSAFTLQFLCAAMAGILLGAKHGAFSQALYLVLGLLGIPVFASGGGITYVLQPTFGFLFASIPAAWLIGRITERKRTRRRIILACIAGLSVLYLIGLPYMALIARFFLQESWSFNQLLLLGMLPFLPGDAIKIALCTLFYPHIEFCIRRLYE